MTHIKPLHLRLTSPTLPERGAERATYGANGEDEAHGVEHRGGDCAGVVGVPDAVIATEKAHLIRADLTQVKDCQRQTPCGGQDRAELTTGRGERGTKKHDGIFQRRGSEEESTLNTEKQKQVHLKTHSDHL